jgi:hypothetical protein
VKTSSIGIVFAAMAVCAVSQAQGQVFAQKTYAGMYTYNHADLNNDGREDLVYHTQNGFAVVLSTGPGTYAAPVSYNVPDNLPAATVTLDLNNDGKLDVIAFNASSSGFYEYLNTGDGGLKLETTYQTAVQVSDMVVGDFNHDGYADIAYTDFEGGLNVLFNNHSGGFTAGPATSVPGISQLSVGDFDGDGAADICATSDLGSYLYFGDNTGHFTTVNATTEHGPYYYLMDLFGNGQSDLVGVAVASSDGLTNTYYKDVWIVYGNQFRDIIEESIPLNGYAVPWTWGDVPEKSPSVDVADFSGDGLRDFALVEAENPDGTGMRSLVVKLNQLNWYAPEINVYSSSELDFGVAAIRGTDTLKPGLLVDTFANNTQTAQFFLNDGAGGYFGGCEFPDTAIGIRVCSPTTYTSTSVLFSASAAGQTTMRKVEVWVDGEKKYQEKAKHDSSHYGLMDGTVTLSPGTHQVTIVAAGYDNLEVKKSYTITVQ